MTGWGDPLDKPYTCRIVPQGVLYIGPYSITIRFHDCVPNARVGRIAETLGTLLLMLWCTEDLQFVTTETYGKLLEAMRGFGAQADSDTGVIFSRLVVFVGFVSHRICSFVATPYSSCHA